MSILDQFSLNGRVAIMTGASSGLGAHASVGLAEAGADVVLVARRAEKLADTAAAVAAAGREALVVPGDVADPETATNVVQATMDHFGKVDILVNNAGIGTAVPANHETVEQFRNVIDINLNGC